MSTKYALIHDSWTDKLAYVFRSVDNRADKWELECIVHPAPVTDSYNSWKDDAPRISFERGDRILTAEEYKQFYTNNIELFL